MPLPTNLDIFLKVCDKVFIETGTGTGEGINKILTLKKYRQIYSVEYLLHSKYFDLNKVIEEFKKFPNVKIVHGESVSFLRDTIFKIN